MTDERRQKIDFAFLNAGHFFDHFLILIFATVAVAMATDRQVEISGVSSEWGMSYAELIPFSVAGFTAFGLCSVPAGWIADKAICIVELAANEAFEPPGEFTIMEERRYGAARVIFLTNRT